MSRVFNRTWIKQPGLPLKANKATFFIVESFIYYFEPL
jgi:hypothetical protein